MFILNAFSLNMLGGNADIVVREITRAVAASFAPACVSAVGHADTAAAVFSSVLGVEIPCSRATVALKEGDVALVGQYSGPRLPEGATTLPEGATTLPEGATIKWVVVGVNAPALEGQDND